MSPRRTEDTDHHRTLATKAELREEGERTRRHFDVVAESLRDDIRLIAGGFAHLTHRVDDHETRIRRLEGDQRTGSRHRG